MVAQSINCGPDRRKHLDEIQKMAEAGFEHIYTAQTSGVAVWAHVGGFVFGLLIGFLMRGRARGLQYDRRA